MHTAGTTDTERSIDYRLRLASAPENGIAKGPGNEVWRFVRAGAANHKLQDGRRISGLGRNGHKDDGQRLVRSVVPAVDENGVPPGL